MTEYEIKRLEDRIRELWNEKEGLLKENAKLKKHLMSARAEFQRQYKENAELKEKIEVLECDNYNANCKLNLITDQLTKATKLLKWALHSDPEHDNLVDFDTKWKEAEQFLKEIEK